MTRQSSSLVAVVDSLPAGQVVLIPDVSQVQGLNDDVLSFASATENLNEASRESQIASPARQSGPSDGVSQSTG